MLFMRRCEFPSEIQLIKVDKYKLSLNNNDFLKKTGKFWKSKLFSNYFNPVNAHEIKGVFDHYEIPFGRERDILISPFQMINIQEIVLFIISIYLVTKLFVK